MSTNPNLIIYAGELAADLKIRRDQQLYFLTVANDESSDSQSSINTVNLQINAPFTVVGTPPGWQVHTNNTTFVLWFSMDPANHIAPGESLAGFKIQSSSQVPEPLPFTLTARDKTTHNPSGGLVGAVIPTIEDKVCLVDNSNGGQLSFTPVTGAYTVTFANGFVLSGTGTVNTKGCYMVLTQGPNEHDRRVLIRVDTCLHTAVGSVQFFPSQLNTSIFDRNLSDLNCN